MALLLGSGPGIHALEKAETAEYLLKARILLTLLPYVEWPANAAGGDLPFDIVVLGRSPFGPYLDGELRKLTVHHRVIRVRYVSKLAEAEGCQALFICASEAKRVNDILAWARGRQVLTLADDVGLSGRGVMINLLLEEQKVRLAVNLEVVRASGFVLSSRLMPLARIIATPAPAPASQKS
jgi:hypothetical protein